MTVLSAGILMGRVLLWANRKRRPKLWELAIEPAIMATSGAFGTVALFASGAIDTDKAIGLYQAGMIGSIGALSGFAGQQTILIAMGVLTRRLGIKSPCEIEIRDHDK